MLKSVSKTKTLLLHIWHYGKKEPWTIPTIIGAFFIIIGPIISTIPMHGVHYTAPGYMAVLYPKYNVRNDSFQEPLSYYPSEYVKMHQVLNKFGTVTTQLSYQYEFLKTHKPSSYKLDMKNLPFGLFIQLDEPAKNLQISAELVENGLEPYPSISVNSNGIAFESEKGIEPIGNKYPLTLDKRLLVLYDGQSIERTGLYLGLNENDLSNAIKKINEQADCVVKINCSWERPSELQFKEIHLSGRRLYPYNLLATRRFAELLPVESAEKLIGIYDGKIRLKVRSRFHIPTPGGIIPDLNMFLRLFETKEELSHTMGNVEYDFHTPYWLKPTSEAYVPLKIAHRSGNFENWLEGEAIVDWEPHPFAKITFLSAGFFLISTGITLFFRKKSRENGS